MIKSKTLLQIQDKQSPNGRRRQVKLSSDPAAVEKYNKVVELDASCVLVNDYRQTPSALIAATDDFLFQTSKEKRFIK